MCGSRPESEPVNHKRGALTSAPTDSVVPLHFQFPPIRYLRAMVVDIGLDVPVGVVGELRKQNEP